MRRYESRLSCVCLGSFLQPAMNEVSFLAVDAGMLMFMAEYFPESVAGNLNMSLW
jgi:hypothetical protein